MKEEIRSHIDDAAQLERLYRGNKSAFKRDFSSLYPEVKGHPLAGFWSERLNYQSDEISWGSKGELTLVIIASLVAGFIAKLPAIFGIDENYFYPRNIGFIVFPLLTAYFAWKNKLPAGKTAMAAGAILTSLLFINLLPRNDKSDTLILSCIHLGLFLWCVLGFTFSGGTRNPLKERLSFLKYNGDLVVMTTLILIAGGIMSGITIGLFSLIGFHIEQFYSKNVVVFGVAAAPIIGTYLTQTNPQLVGKVSPVIARLFSPLVAVMLVVYLVAIVRSGKDPYSNREFLLIFNALLVGVMAIIFFSVAETARTTKSRAETYILFALAILTIIVNGVALSAIVFRISQWGFTPNRAAVLGGNVLILINLLLVTWQLFRVARKDAELSVVGQIISRYLPFYFVWTIIVTFLFPFVFGFK
ncbi:hypothetical protein DYU05_01060 [Mucilaginibacter terrenus]|uniref:DUF4153 domain-containing protein n=1 Tax=Mucilaginibacter terrenus TaxID=2482727 RepID=A0A3E2NTR7_9SPHI|nr:hypothetical protein [Mucilaginibacter terrenus]RFZ84250.1 hypothetical protein DYU05_01060 [Mucilaginibacter terrenus]